MSIIIASLSSCTIFRAMKYGNASVSDYQKYDQDTVRRGETVFSFVEKTQQTFLDTLRIDYHFTRQDTTRKMTIDEAQNLYPQFKSAVLIIRNDSILFENYYGGWNRDTQSGIFSVTKTITSMLCGVAMKDGYIHSLQDPVTDYIPELLDKDPMFRKLTVGHLLDMTAGLDFEENYNINPFSKMAQLYLGPDALKVIEKIKFSHEPGTRYHYDSMTTAILGLVIERATGQSYSDYLSERIWQPLGMERDALMSLDSYESGIAKAYGGLTTNVRDLAKIGRLYLQEGNWNGVQILDSAFVARSLSTSLVGESNRGTYSCSWYWAYHDPQRFADLDTLKAHYADHMYAIYLLDKDTGTYHAITHEGGFWGFGLYGQVLYVHPEKNFIGIYLGTDRIEDYHRIFDRLARYMN